MKTDIWVCNGRWELGVNVLDNRIENGKGRGLNYYLYIVPDLEIEEFYFARMLHYLLPTDDESRTSMTWVCYYDFHDSCPGYVADRGDCKCICHFVVNHLDKELEKSFSPYLYNGEETDE